MSVIVGVCACCKKTKSLMYGLSTPRKHCARCHKLGYTSYEEVRHETKAEYFARLGREIDAARGGPQPVIIPPPRPPRIVTQPPRVVSQMTEIQIKARREREALAERKRQWVRTGVSELEALRQETRRQMDERRKNYTPRRSLTPLK